MDRSGQVSVEMPDAIPPTREEGDRGSTVEEHTGKKLADIRMGEFIVQAILAVSLFLFACVNLSVDPKGAMSNFWIAMIATIIGTFMPNPKMKSVKTLFAKKNGVQ